MSLPRIGFDRASIRALLPIEGETPCVYRIRSITGQLVYLGATVSPRRRLLEHLLDPAKAEAGFMVELDLCRTTTEMARRERAAVAEEAPLLNDAPGRRHGAWRAQMRG